MSDKWIVRTNVPILDEHTLTDDDGKEICQVDKRRLQHIASVNNKRIKDTGDEVPIVVGHTDDDSPEDRQPKIVGYARNFKVGQLFKTGRTAIHATFRFRKSARKIVEQYPRRSVELWLSDWKLDPISLLGATTPERDLGLLRLSRAGKRKYKRICPMLPTDNAAAPDAKPTASAGNTGVAPDQNFVQATVAAIMETDVFKWLKSQMEQAQNAEPEPDPNGLPPEEGDVNPDDMGNDEGDLPPGDDEGDDDFDDDDEGDDDFDDDEDDDDDNPEPPQKPARYSATAPSGSNTSIPSSNVIKPQYSRQNKKGRVRMSRDQTRTQQSVEKQQLAAACREIANLKVKYQRAERERDLIQLESEGVILDRNEELDAVEAMSPRLYAKHLNRIRHRYAKSPIGVAGLDKLMQNGRSGVTGRMTKERSLQVADYAQKRNMTFDAALEELEGVEE